MTQIERGRYVIRIIGALAMTSGAAAHLADEYGYSTLVPAAVLVLFASYAALQIKELDSRLKEADDERPA